MAIAKTEGIIIRCRKFRETSLIVTFYTRDFGLMRAVAKGARGARSNFRSSLDLFAYGQLVAYVKDNRDLQLLSDFDSVRTFGGVQGDLRRFAYAGAAGELIEALVAGEESNPELLDLLLGLLDLLETSPGDAVAALFRAYQIKTCGLLGYKPELDRCVGCGRTDGAMRFSPRMGGVICSNCGVEAFDATRLSGTTLETLRILSVRALAEVASAAPSAARVEREVAPLLDAFLQYHVERYRGLKSLQFLKTLTA
jgi:DNA repair protein RecO (recombination protein O)